MKLSKFDPPCIFPHFSQKGKSFPYSFSSFIPYTSLRQANIFSQKAHLLLLYKIKLRTGVKIFSKFFYVLCSFFVFQINDLSIELIIRIMNNFKKY